MNKLGVNVQYIYHSGFRVETDRRILIFDYFKGKVQLGDKQTLVFASHAHPDHFRKKIFDWSNDQPDIAYILSSDIRHRPEGLNIKALSPYEETTLADVHIKTFGSTDAGVSFLVETDGLRIFHAGDLNWWYWWGESPEEIANAEKMFKEEMAKIKGEAIDLAFFPVDPRLEHNSDVGADYFIQEIAPKILIPMHFGDQADAALKYAEKMKGASTQVIAFTEPNQEISL
ncbi:MAG: MBL fold metallo-hydrolase [Clostridia bacterium]|jgi:L-ascorbate metabolism protein UlaG (beta-lactamase superfamily)|nr:MBL fold metallo-hydrolase [Clostridia bacterium]